jgi:hypothetical protein
MQVMETHKKKLGADHSSTLANEQSCLHMERNRQRYRSNGTETYGGMCKPAEAHLRSWSSPYFIILHNFSYMAESTRVCWRISHKLWLRALGKRISHTKEN